jgi:hypothetical protein
LAEVISDVVKAAAGHDLRFKVRVELGGESPPPDSVVRQVDKSLKSVSDKLKLGEG